MVKIELANILVELGNMPKKVIFVLILVLIILGGGIFLWRMIPEKKIQGSPADYQVLETEEGKFIENKKAGLKVRVPDGWIVEKIEVMEGSMVIYSPDAEGMREGRVKPPLKKGCIIEIAVAYKKADLEELKKEIENTHTSFIVKSDTFETIEVNGVPALKNIFHSADLGYSIDIYIPISALDKLYGLGITAGPGDIERCSQEFDKFLENVSIEED